MHDEMRLNSYKMILSLNDCCDLPAENLSSAGLLAIKDDVSVTISVARDLLHESVLGQVGITEVEFDLLANGLVQPFLAAPHLFFGFVFLYRFFDGRTLGRLFLHGSVSFRLVVGIFIFFILLFFADRHRTSRSFFVHRLLIEWRACMFLNPEKWFHALGNSTNRWRR